MNSFSFSLDTIERLQTLARHIRRDILRQVFVAGTGHSGGALSMVEIIVSIFEHTRTYYPAVATPRLVISKGHAAACLYAWLVNNGHYPRNLLDTYRMLGSPFQAHVKPPTKETPGIPGFFPSGSLTHGLSLASGLALAARHDEPSYPLPVFCVMGDTEMQGGQVWEAARQLAVHELSGVIAICDNNGMGNDYATAATLDVGDLKARWLSCGWNVCVLDDGHALPLLLSALCVADLVRQGAVSDWPGRIQFTPAEGDIGHARRRPTIIIATTIKGKGISYMENDNKWHGQAPNEEQFLVACQELGIDDSEKGEILTARRARQKKESTTIFLKEKTLRDGPADALVPLMEHDRDIIIIAPELAESTRAAKLKKIFPDRVHNFGVQEPNAMDAVAGLSFAGKKPVILTFANFALLRTVDQIFQNIAPFSGSALIIGTHDGFVQDGTSVIPSNHYAIARSFYQSVVLSAADYYEAKGLTQAALASGRYTFLFISREDMPLVFDADTHFSIGVAKVYSPRYGGWVDRTIDSHWKEYVSKTLNIVVAGSPFVWLAQQAIRELYRERGIDISLINMSTIKPLDTMTLEEAFRASRRLCVIEKHSPYGGLYAAVAEYMGEHELPPGSVTHYPRKEWIGQSGVPDALLAHYGFDTDSLKVFLLAAL